jgi:ABC-type dipeptide/oligopeptide/nickel transport system ATPase component
MVYQNPGSALNPSMLVGDQIGEVFSAHGGSGRGQKRQRVLELLRQVQLAEPASVYSRYPHQLSGGMQQRGRHRHGARRAA